MPSQAFGFAQAKRENISVAKEIGFSPSPSAMLGFLNDVSGGYLTKAGLTHQTAFLEVKKRFEKDEADGIKSYLPLEKTSIIE